MIDCVASGWRWYLVCGFLSVLTSLYDWRFFKRKIKDVRYILGAKFELLNFFLLNDHTSVSIL